MYPFDEIKNVRDRLIAQHETVAVAESVTSGRLQAALSLAEDARQFYQGGITAYNLGQKCRRLLIEPIHALDCICVSERVAEKMAMETALAQRHAPSRVHLDFALSSSEPSGNKSPKPKFI